MVNVPAGVEEGTRIRYQGEGDAGRFGGPNGDLYIVLAVKAHEFFEREGNDLHCVMPISVPQAALGDELSIPTLEGETTLKIPEGTQSGKEFRIRGKGVPHLNERGRGDLVVADRGADAEEADQGAARTAAAAGGNDDRREQADLAQPFLEGEGDV